MILAAGVAKIVTFLTFRYFFICRKDIRLSLDVAIVQLELLKSLFGYMQEEAARTAHFISAIRDVLYMGDFFPKVSHLKFILLFFTNNCLFFCYR